MKKPYSTPELIEHGTVTELTAGIKLFGVADLGTAQHVTGSHGGGEEEFGS